MIITNYKGHYARWCCQIISKLDKFCKRISVEYPTEYYKGWKHKFKLII